MSEIRRERREATEIPEREERGENRIFVILIVSCRIINTIDTTDFYQNESIVFLLGGERRLISKKDERD